MIFLLCRTKHLWTAFASVLLPKCFSSRESLVGKEPGYGARMFERFYKANSILFFIIFSVVGVVTANIIIRWTEVNSFDCSNLPFLSFIEECFMDSDILISDPILDLPQPHSWFYVLGNVIIISLSFLHIILVAVESYFIGDLNTTYV